MQPPKAGRQPGLYRSKTTKGVVGHFEEISL
jgi:hypothetical protein